MIDVIAPEKDAFVLKNGGRIRSISELITSLKKMPAQLYNFHVRGNRNDFAYWIENKLQMKSLAKEIRKAENRAGMVKILQKHPLVKPKKIHISNNKSKLNLQHETEQEYQPLLIASCLAIGLVAGVALTMLFLLA